MAARKIAKSPIFECLPKCGSETIKGDSNPNDKYILSEDLYEPWILIQVSSKSVENGEVMCN